MSEKNQIDDIFKNTLHDFQEVEPSKKVWLGITSGVFLNSVVLSFVSSLTKHTASWLVGSVCVLGTTAFLIINPDINSNSDETLTTTIQDESAEKNLSKTQHTTFQKTKENLSANANSTNKNTQTILINQPAISSEPLRIQDIQASLKNTATIEQNNKIIQSGASAIEKPAMAAITNPTSTNNTVKIKYATSDSNTDLIAMPQFSGDSVMLVQKKTDSLVFVYKDSLQKADLFINSTNVPQGKPIIDPRFSLFTYGSLTKITKNLSGDIPGSAYVTKRNNSEEAVTNLGFGSELRYLLNNHFYIKSGFSLATYGEKVDYLMRQFVGLDSTSITDSVFSYSYTKAVNRFTYAEVPLTLGSRFVVNKTTLYFDGGVSIGYLINASGKIINKENINSTVHISATRLPFTKFMYNYIIRAGISYNVYNNISIFAESFYKRNIKSVLCRKYDIQQKYSSMGINVGIKFDL